jgi:hypothetical protein
VTRPGLLGPAQPHGSGGPAKKNKKILQKVFQKNLWFFCKVFTAFWSISVCIFIYCKDTNPVLKYPVFIKTLKKILCFHAYGQVSLKKIIIILHLDKKKSFSMHFGLNNRFIKVTRTCQYFKNSKKIILFYFNIWGYDLIRKTYSGY